MTNSFICSFHDKTEKEFYLRRKEKTVIEYVGHVAESNLQPPLLAWLAVEHTGEPHYCNIRKADQYV